MFFFVLFFFILLGLTNKGHNIYHVQTVSHWVFPEINSMGCRVAESFSINKDREAVLRFSWLASENNVDCIVVVVFFFVRVLICLIPFVIQASLWSCIPARCLSRRWSPCTMVFWLTVPPPSISKSRSSKTCRPTFRRKTQGCKKQTENVSFALAVAVLLQLSDIRQILMVAPSTMNWQWYQ